MTIPTLLNALKKQGRNLCKAQAGQESLGPLAQLPGLWRNTPDLGGRGWNMIALPFARDPLGYRLLVNQYNEELRFSLVDDGVPNRGVLPGVTNDSGDQLLVALDYEQTIEQIAADDSPKSAHTCDDLTGKPGLPIHHEPGLWLNMLNHLTDDLNIARLSTIPHGNSVLALGRSSVVQGVADIPDINGLPTNISRDLEGGYLAPYKHFNDNPFKGVFNPVQPNALLNAANQGVNVVRTTVLHVDSTIESGGISNIPFIVKQADAAEMESTFWIQELADRDQFGEPRLRLQYSQTVMLDFIDRGDGTLIRWPHVSINTMEKVPGFDR